MTKFRPIRLLLMALVLSFVPVSSFAGVFISVNFAPPVLPMYDVPPCPEAGWIWTPGYWAYGPDGYYWVPGSWVPAPYEGALWTPGYWGWSSNVYIWHPGYWGRHVGYYGGVNYGGGYFGMGFAGGMWRGRDFVYNTAVIRVGPSIHRTYVDREIVHRYTIVNDRRVAFSGGPGGIRHDMRPEERMAERDRHMAATSFQSTHENTARGDRSSYFRNNNGRPGSTAVQRPLGFNSHQSGPQNFNQPQNQRMQPQNQPRQQFQPQNQQRFQQDQQKMQNQQRQQFQPQSQQHQQQPQQFQQQNQQRFQQEQQRMQQQNQMQQQRQLQQNQQRFQQEQQRVQQQNQQRQQQFQPRPQQPERQVQPQHQAQPQPQHQQNHGNEHERR